MTLICIKIRMLRVNSLSLWFKVFGRVKKKEIKNKGIDIIVHVF